MYSFREILIFFAGVQAFHTFTHLALMFSGLLPITIWGIHFTQLHNIGALAISGLSTVALMWWAAQLT